MTTIIEFYIPKDDKKKTCARLSKYFKDIKKCQLIEEGICEYCRQYCESNRLTFEIAIGIYKDCVNNIIFNCEQNGNTIQEIIAKINANSFNPHNLAFLKPEELNWDNWSKIITRKINTEDKLNNLPCIKWNPCRRCKNVEHFYRQLQTRSADEPMTTYYICKQCGKTNKVNN
jgi:DNA-directed RNA polymerase subunit M/transcription elongation factor TFIIS